MFKHDLSMNLALKQISPQVWILPVPSVLRNAAFKLKPIKMSQDLIQQLMAVATKLEGCGGTLQGLIGKKKHKNKHYVPIISEALTMFVLPLPVVSVMDTDPWPYTHCM